MDNTARFVNLGHPLRDLLTFSDALKRLGDQRSEDRRGLGHSAGRAHQRSSPQAIFRLLRDGIALFSHGFRGVSYKLAQDFVAQGYGILTLNPKKAAIQTM